jgi:endogenous inhibitor of DNA gyrase (YacG/DUF329 family)
MIRGKCPLCGKAFEVAKLADQPSFPFCSDRCRLVDLGRWIDGAYVLPEKSRDQTSAPSEVESEEDDED